VYGDCRGLSLFLTTTTHPTHVNLPSSGQQSTVRLSARKAFVARGEGGQGQRPLVRDTTGDFSTCDAPRPGRPKTLTTAQIIERIHELILEDGRISAKSIAEQLDISHERVGSNIHEDFDMQKISAKWVPKCLNADQKRQRCQPSEQNLEFFRREPNNFVLPLLTMEETWLYHQDPETKQQSLEWRKSG